MQKIYIGGDWVDTGKYFEVRFPYDDRLVETVSQGQYEHIELAIQKAEVGFEKTKKLSPYQKAEILTSIVSELKKQKEEFAELIVLENGKTIKEARLEMERCIYTFQIAIGEAERIYGEYIDYGINPLALGRHGIVKKFPIGIVAGITPFNFPMNLSAHKIAPAIATGCPIIIKPASTTPLSMLKLAKIIEGTAWPKMAFSVIPCDRIVGQKLVTDNRIKLLSFTGSPSVGWKMKEQAGKKKVILELGGNAACIIDQNIENWDYLIDRLTMGAYYQAGQSCISVQKIYAHEKIYDEFVEKFSKKINSMKIGNPLEENTDMGGIIDKKNKDRLASWIQKSIDGGATCIFGNHGNGTILYPTLLTGSKNTDEIVSEEAFGPVAVLYKYKDINEAIKDVNNSKFGLQIGIFSKNIDLIWKIYNETDVGGVIQNDVPSFRVDAMPYGGIKDSGFGREGIRYAMQDMLEEKVLVLKPE